MTLISRNAFLKMGGIVALAPLVNNLFSRVPLGAPGAGNSFENDLLPRLVKANDRIVADLLKMSTGKDFKFSRKIGYDIANLSAAYVSPTSSYYKSNEVKDKLEALTGVLLSFQKSDGTVNSGNLESPPDTGFLVELLTAAARILTDFKDSELEKSRAGLKTFLINSGKALVTGGVHTPNHRWVISAALARLHDLYPNKAYTDRVEEWLGEGIFIDADGHYPERSGIYSGVENSAFISIGRLLNKPTLFEPVRKNLRMTYYYMHPNGELVTNDSRRQDQYMQKNAFNFYLQYRFMALRDNDAHFAAVCNFMEQLPGFEAEVITNGLFHFLEEPILQRSLPRPAALPVNYEKLFDTSHLLRIRRNDTSITLFGGVDWPLIIASGRSDSPNFFNYRKGNAILEYARLSTNFFSTGYFYSEGLKKTNDGYQLHRKMLVPYYQPLPKNLRNKTGDYTLSPSIDDRFWNKMDFSKRPVSNVKTLETTVTLKEKEGMVDLDFDVKGLEGVAVTIELCFNNTGILSGTTLMANGDALLKEGFATFTNEGDSFKFGPGAYAGAYTDNLEGERYKTHFGSLRTEGQHVYLTGHTPFKHTLRFS